MSDSVGLLDDALRLISNGVSVIPIRSDGSKRPAVGEWAPYQERLATPEECVEWFSDGRNGIAAICGPISGGLEVMDFDVPGKPDNKTPPAWQPWCEMLKAHGYDDLLAKLVVCSTPSGGRHVAYRCKGIKDGNAKLAQCEDSKPLIETRGVGGYFAIAPTTGYSEMRGTIRFAPEITESERETLHVCARLLTEKVERVAYEKNYPAGKRPGDDYNLRGEPMQDLLMRHGWRPVHGRDGKWANFTRPDKQEGISGGISASTGLFHVFTTSTTFEAGKGYSKFSVYSVLDHGGDFVMAARTLGAEGYGESKFKPDVSRETSERPSYLGPVDVSLEDEDAIWTTLKDIEEGIVTWGWNKRIPLDALTLISGDPGEGKSSLLHALIATITSGGVFPCGQRCEPSNVVLVSFEDSPGLVLRKRLRLMGADLSRVSILHTEKKDEDGVPIFDFGKLTIDMVFRRVKKVGASWLFIDPIVEFIGAAINMNSANEVRPFMSNLRFNCELLHCAGVLNAHNNKNTGGKALYRTVGSIDFPAACRSVFQVGCDPDNPEHKVFAHVKHNWSKKQPSLTFEVSDVEDIGVFGWIGTSDLNAEDLSMPAKPREEREKSNGCKEWLESYLKDGPVDAVTIKEIAKEMGYGRRVLEGARDALHVRIERVSYGNKGGGGWKWALTPEEDPYENP